MGFSPLAALSRRIPDIGRSSPRQSQITGFTIHHNGGVDAYGQATAPGREVSANYWITNAGAILPNVDESRRAWTSGAPGYPAGAAADHRNITVEVSNSPEGVRTGTWAISDAAARALIALIADVHQRYRLGPVRRGADRGVGVHQDWVPTACPGPYIMRNLGGWIAEAEKIRAGVPKPPAPKKRKRKNMLGLTIIDGEGRYGVKGGQYYATYDGRAHVSLGKADADKVSVMLGESFANVTYAAWEGYIKAAEVVV